eukprot:7387756-Prymnesium_polylepis.1
MPRASTTHSSTARSSRQRAALLEEREASGSGRGRRAAQGQGGRQRRNCRPKAPPYMYCVKRRRLRFQTTTFTSSSVCQLEAPFNWMFTAPLEPAGDHDRRTPRGSRTQIG